LSLANSTTSGLSAEISRAISAETVLSTDLSTETSRAISAETALSTAVSTNISTETSRAISAETVLSTDLSTETSRAISAETALSTSFSTDLSAEVSRAISTETSIETRLSTEESRFYGTFQGEITQAALSLTGDITAGSFTTTSDARLKKDIVNVSNALEMVGQIRPVYYNWIDERPTINPGHKEIGFLAQELEAVLPNVVTTASTEEYPDQKRVAYDRLVSLLIGAVNELNAEVRALKVEVDALKKA
jgi:hypothetical protein